jgi:hypothetical protein
VVGVDALSPASSVSVQCSAMCNSVRPALSAGLAGPLERFSLVRPREGQEGCGGLPHSVQTAPCGIHGPALVPVVPRADLAHNAAESEAPRQHSGLK